MLNNASVTSLRSLPGGVSGAPLDGFEVGYVTEDRREHRIPLADAWSALFETAAPVRSFPSWSTSTGLTPRTDAMRSRPFTHRDRHPQ
jgi:hypothetical protein